MKYEDIKKLKAGDKIVVRLAIDDVDRLNEILPNTDEKEWFSLQLYKTQILGKVSDFWQQKIKFTKAEKAEFDQLDIEEDDVLSLLNKIYYGDSQFLYLRLFGNDDVENKENQFEFVRAIEHPKLVEMEKEKKYYIKILGQYLVRNTNEAFGIELVDKKNADKFSMNEILEMNSWSKFAEVDLTKCKEAIEDEN